ncbi:DUF2790 domain-containing protein [Pseudomonas sp. BW13M1]|uniref:DUF2790 domain-containing protein n=1 Tax=Pseudomonas peradeniyensis TaxID=2745488 RepID=A0A923JYX4_9PSED|nr:DUF2790 domain-containing protein [Pseudomonas peradeniyensis]MBV4506351.1 DUF2790 domain-containing protein [Pseudomonas peradeniyensis]
MTLRKAFALTVTTLALGTSASSFASEATPYRYGMDLDIAKVISIDAPTSAQGQASTATLTYRDSSGQLRAVSYVQPTVLANQN